MIVVVGSAPLLCLLTCLAVLYLPANPGASTTVVGYRLHLVERPTRDLDFSELVLIVTRPDGAVYQQQLEYSARSICTALTTEQQEQRVYLQCRKPDHTIPVIYVDRVSERLYVDVPFLGDGTPLAQLQFAEPSYYK